MAEKAKLETLKQRAELILQFERVMSKAERKNPQYHPKYLHALVAADEVEDELGAEEAGVINGVTESGAGQLRSYLILSHHYM